MFAYIFTESNRSISLKDNFTVLKPILAALKLIPADFKTLYIRTILICIALEF